MKVKVTIDTTVAQVEISNMLLAAACGELAKRKDIRKSFGVTLAQVRAASRFRLSLLASFTNNPKPTDYGLCG